MQNSAKLALKSGIRVAIEPKQNSQKGYDFFKVQLTMIYHFGGVFKHESITSLVTFKKVYTWDVPLNQRSQSRQSHRNPPNQTGRDGKKRKKAVNIILYIIKQYVQLS